MKYFLLSQKFIYQIVYVYYFKIMKFAIVETENFILFQIKNVQKLMLIIIMMNYLKIILSNFMII